MRLERNHQYLGDQKVTLQAGKNLFTFPQTLTEPGFYGYDVFLEAPGYPIPQNNRASGFASVQGDPRVLIISSEPDQDSDLLAASCSIAATTSSSLSTWSPRLAAPSTAATSSFVGS